MSNIKKIAYLTAMVTIIIALLIANISIATDRKYTGTFTAEDVKVGDTITLQYETAKKRTDFFCVERDQHLWDPCQLKVIYKVNIEGNVATNADNKNEKFENKWNGIIAYILSKSKGPGLKPTPEAKEPYLRETSLSQWLIYYDMFDWIKQFTAETNKNISETSRNLLKGFATPPGTSKDKDEHYQNNINIHNDGVKYADSLKNEDLKNRTIEESVKVDTYENNNKKYLKVGPFKYEFKKQLTSVTLSEKDEKDKIIASVTPVKYAVYNGKTLKEVKLSDIESKKEFYVIIDENCGLSKINHIKVTSTKEEITATIAFWKNTESEKNTHWQNLIQFVTDKKEVPIENNWNPKITLVGNLRITKKDYDSQDTNIANVTLKVRNEDGKYVKVDDKGTPSYVDEADATIFKTDEKGEITIKNLLVGVYTITEISNPSKAYGGEEGKVTDVYYSTSANGEKIEVKTEENNTSSEDENKEIKLPDITIEVKAGSESYTTVNIYNKKKYIDISGYVWEDYDGKKDNSYESHEKDIYAPKTMQENGTEVGDNLVSGITVNLIDTRKDTSENIIQTTTTDDNGHYKFTNLLIEELENYYVEFVYDGLTYTTVAPNADTDVKSYNERYSKQIESSDEVNSKAIEVVEQRKTLNGNFAEITNHEDIYDRYSGFTRDEKGIKTGTITYKDSVNEDGEVVNNSVSYDSYSGDINVTANTNINPEYSISKSYENGNFITNEEDGSIEIPNINMGLHRRETPNISIKNDLTRVHLQVNGLGWTYKDEFETPDREEDDDDYGLYTKEEIDQRKLGNVEAKFGSEHGPYYRSVYPSDIKFSSTLSKEEDAKKLKIYAVYTVTVKNNSNSLTMGVPEIVNYYDNGYDIIGNNVEFPLLFNLNGAKIVAKNIDELEEDDNANAGEPEVIDEDNIEHGEVNGFKSARIKLSDNIASAPQLEAGKSLKLEITYKVSDDTVLELLNEEKVMKNVSEISAYSTYYSKDIEGCNAGEFYAGIDKNSAPENAIPSNSDGEEEDVSTYEDDTDSAPDFILRAKGVRQIEGTVFEDKNIIDENSEGPHERVGDGKLNEGENKVQKVKVDLLRAETLTNAKYYPYNVNKEGDPLNAESGVSITSIEELGETTASIYTDEYGYYIFKGIEPDDYYIRFTYENGETVICDVNGNPIADVLVQNYKSTIITSEVIKNAFTTEDLTWYMKQERETSSTARDDLKIRQELDNKLKTITAKTKEELKSSSLSADTPKFGIEVEYKSTETDSDNNLFIHKISNINFGIIERPRQEVGLEKHIKNIKVTLQNGQILIDGDPKTGKLDLVSVLPDGNYVITLSDSELLGAHIEIDYEFSVYNNSEIDYVDKSGNISELYYYYGDTAGGNVVSLTSATIIDYVDSEVVLKEGQVGEDKTWKAINGTWDVIDAVKNGLNLDLSVEEIQKLVETYSTVVIAEPISKDQPILPGGDPATTTISVERLLANADEDLVYENDGEVAKITKIGGGEPTEDPGDYGKILLSNGDDDEESVTIDNYELDVDEAKAETVTVIPPQGSTDYTVTYAIIGAISLTILSAGIFGIKKVLKQ